MDFLPPHRTYHQYKVRKINNTPVYVITIPSELVQKFKLENVKFRISYEEGKLIFTSGLDLVEFKKNIDKYDIENF